MKKIFFVIMIVIAVAIALCNNKRSVVNDKENDSIPTVVVPDSAVAPIEDVSPLVVGSV
jgi:uncharacterized alpha/beta hydrolase family protein